MINEENDYIRFIYNAPILNIIIKKKESIDAEFKFATDYIQKFYNAMIELKVRMCLLIDLTEIKEMGINQYNLYYKWAKFFNKIKKQTEICIYRSGLLTNSKIVNSLIKSFFFLYKPIRPIKISSNREELEEYIKL